MKEIRLQEPSLTPEASRLTLHDIDKFGELLAEVAITLAGTHSMAPGAATKLQTVKIHEKGDEYEWDMGQIKKTK